MSFFCLFLELVLIYFVQWDPISFTLREICRPSLKSEICRPSLKRSENEERNGIQHENIPVRCILPACTDSSVSVATRCQYSVADPGGVPRGPWPPPPSPVEISHKKDGRLGGHIDFMFLAPLPSRWIRCWH